MQSTPASDHHPAPPQSPRPTPWHTEISGYCRACGTTHRLGSQEAIAYCRKLMDHFRHHATIDLTPASDSDPRLSTAPLFGEARGKMFGILVCARTDGTTAVLRAFSGQYNGLWEVEGWVPPLFSTTAFQQVNDPAEREIKALGRELTDYEPHSPAWLEVKRRRRRLSRQLMQKIHGLYRLTNFNGHTVPLSVAFIGESGIATGTGDCCAPKLLGFAAASSLTPLALAEFYWGRDNRSGNRRHGCFYPPCEEKCSPILGYLLCGHNARQDALHRIEPGL